MGTEEVNAYSQWLGANGVSQPGRNARSTNTLAPLDAELYSCLQTWHRDLM